MKSFYKIFHLQGNDENGYLSTHYYSTGEAQVKVRTWEEWWEEQASPKFYSYITHNQI